MPWEYRQVVHVVPSDPDGFADDDEHLTSLGAMGWELVSAFAVQRYGQTVAVVYVYKRPLPREFSA